MATEDQAATGTSMEVGAFVKQLKQIQFDLREALSSVESIDLAVQAMLRELGVGSPLQADDINFVGPMTTHYRPEGMAISLRAVVPQQAWPRQAAEYRDECYQSALAVVRRGLLVSELHT